MDNELRSICSDEPVPIRFVNKTERNVDILWLNFEGQPIKYQTLLPNVYFDIDTYITHPWIFEDSNTRDRLAVNGETVFFPPRWADLFRKRFPNAPNIPDLHQNRKIVVMIMLPVYKLRERCLQVVRDSLDVTVKKNFLDELQLPKSVLDDLILMVLKKDGFYL